MNYNSIIKNLTQSSEKVQGWAEQGFVPSIEKDSVLALLRETYDELLGSDCVTYTESNPQIVGEPILDSSGETSEDIKEYIRKNHIEIMNEFAALRDAIAVNSNNDTIICEQLYSIKENSSEISSLKESLANQNHDNNLICEQLASIKDIVSDGSKDEKIMQEIASLKGSIIVQNNVITDTENSNANNDADADNKETVEIQAKEVSSEENVPSETIPNIKVNMTPPILGFYSLPEDLRINIIHELFNGDVAKAEISVNKMCTLKSIEELLIYIEEHFSWNPDSATAMELINSLSKKF